MDPKQELFSRILSIYKNDNELHEEYTKIPNEKKSLLKDIEASISIESLMVCEKFYLERELLISKNINLEDHLEKFKDEKNGLAQISSIILDNNTLKIDTDKFKFCRYNINKQYKIYSLKYKTTLIFDIIYVIALNVILNKNIFDAISNTIKINIVEELTDQTVKTRNHKGVSKNVYILNDIYYTDYSDYNYQPTNQIIATYKFLYNVRVNIEDNCIFFNKNTVDKLLFIIIITPETINISGINVDVICKKYNSEKMHIVPHPSLGIDNLKFIIKNFFNFDYNKLYNTIPSSPINPIKFQIIDNEGENKFFDYIHHRTYAYGI